MSAFATVPAPTLRAVVLSGSTVVETIVASRDEPVHVVTVAESLFDRFDATYFDAALYPVVTYGDGSTGPDWDATPTLLGSYARSNEDNGTWDYYPWTD